MDSLTIEMKRTVGRRGAPLKYWRMLKQLPVFTKMLTGLAIGLLPLYAATWSTVTFSEHNVRDEITAHMQNQVQYYLSSLETELERILNSQKEFLSHDPLHQLSNAHEILSYYDRMVHIENIGRSMFVLENSSNYVKNAFAYVRSLNRTIHSDRTVSYVSPHDLKLFLQPDSLFNVPLIAWEHRLYLNVTFPPYRKEPVPQAPVYSIVAEMDQEEIREQLAQFTKQPDSGVMLLDDSGQWSLSSQSGSVPDHPIEEEIRRSLAEAKGGKPFTLTLSESDERYWIVYKKSAMLDAKLAVYFPEQAVLGTLKQYRQRFWLISSLVALFFIGYTIWLYSLFAKQMKKLIRAFRSIEMGELSISIPHDRHDDFGYIYKRFNKMVSELNNLVSKVYKQEILMQKAELKSLQYQINPHFLYNSLFQIHIMAKEQNYEQIVPFTSHLRKYYQFLNNGRPDEVTLEEEWNHAVNYLSIQQMRFNKRLQVRTGELPSRWQSYPVPRLIIQPLLENAFEHGLRKNTRDGQLMLQFMEDRQHLIISVEDNGTELTEARLTEIQQYVSQHHTGQTEQKSQGLQNVHRRLQIRYGALSGLVFVRSRLGGLCVSIRIERGESNHDA